MLQILVVDDSPVARHQIVKRLSSEGFVARGVGSLAEARGAEIAGLRAAVLDVELDGEDGVAVARWLRSVSPTLPLSFFSGGASAELLAEARALGAVFEKPSLDPLVRWVKSLG